MRLLLFLLLLALSLSAEEINQDTLLHPSNDSCEQDLEYDAVTRGDFLLAANATFPVLTSSDGEIWYGIGIKQALEYAITDFLTAGVSYSYIQGKDGEDNAFTWLTSTGYNSTSKHKRHQIGGTVDFHFLGLKKRDRATVMKFDPFVGFRGGAEIHSYYKNRYNLEGYSEVTDTTFNTTSTSGFYDFRLGARFQWSVPGLMVVLGTEEFSFGLSLRFPGRRSKETALARVE